MRKKILALTLAAAMMFSLAACGGGSSETVEEEEEVVVEEEVVEEEEEVVVEEEATEDERSADYMKSVFTGAWAGVDEDLNCYYIAYDEGVEHVALVILAESGEQSLNVVGDVIEDGSYMTVDDQTSGYSITFNVTDIDGGMMLTLKDGTEVIMAPAEVDTVVDIIVAIDNNTEIINPVGENAGEETVEEETETRDYASYMEYAFAGSSSSGALVIFAASDDGTSAVLALVNPDESFDSTYVGSVVVDSDELYTFTNDADGETFSVYMIKSQDDSGNDCVIFTQDGENGFYLYQTDVQTAIDDLHNAGLEF